MATYFKVASSNEPSTYSFILSNSPKWSIGISRVEGADPNNPIDTHSGASGGKDFNAVAPSIVTTTCNAMIMTFYTNKTDATWIAPAGATEVYDDPNYQQGLTSNMMAYYIQANAGATGLKTASASKRDYWVAQQIAIKPMQGRSGSSAARDGIASTNSNRNTGTQISEESEAQVNLVTYPNPVVDRVSIQFPELTKQPQSNTISIFDGIGKSYPVNAIWVAENTIMEIDFSTMNKGLFIIRVSTDSGVQTLKVLKE